MKTPGSAGVTILIVGAMLLAVVLLSGVSYEQLQRAQDREHIAQIAARWTSAATS